jgi:4-alpha-glucanotransferase
VPVQDVLALGSEARMNTPSVPEGNWEFRLGEGYRFREPPAAAI